jgi:hypothetical protein
MGSDTVAFLLTVLGLAAAIGIFLLAARLVAHARAGTRRLRLLRHDPHAPHTAQQQRENDGRDIKQ